MGFLKQIGWKSLLAVFKLKRWFYGWFGTRQLDYSKAKLFLNTQTIREYETRAQSVRKEPKTVSWFEKYSKDGVVIYDIGANVGAYALIAASRGAEVYAFEPSFQNAFRLHENISLNNLDGKITVLPVILGSKNGTARFSVSDTTFGASRGFSDAGEKQGKAYPVLTLDDASRIFSLPVPVAIKIDIDGAEVELLEGAKLLLSNLTLKSMLIETEEKNTNVIKRIMTNAGFSVLEETRMDAHTVNYVFERV
jgi:FkbM family methyltransferase